jgi:hypothetical protein
VGPGARLGRAWAIPVASPTQIARDPVDRSFLVTSRNIQGGDLFRFASDLTFVETLSQVIPDGYDVASLAIRPDGGPKRSIYVIGWKGPSSLGGNQDFVLYVLDEKGKEKDHMAFDPPRPQNGFLSYPAGLTWNPIDGHFYYLERNSNTVVVMGENGETLREFPNPVPPLQSYVFNIGLTFDPSSRTFLLTTSGPHDYDVSEAVGMRSDGTLTGVTVPLADLGYASIGGIAMDGADLVICAYGPGPELVRVQVFDDATPGFIRGDADGDGRLSITDAIRILDYLFLGGVKPACDDASDVDDDGAVTITDAIVFLSYLFLGEGRIPPPSPLPGQDPTPDGLGCY